MGIIYTTIASHAGFLTAVKQATQHMYQEIMERHGPADNEAGMLLSADGNLEIKWEIRYICAALRFQRSMWRVKRMGTTAKVACS